MKDNMATMLDVIRTPGPGLPELPRDANELQIIAHAYACGIAEDEIYGKVHALLEAVELGLYKHVKCNMRGVNGNSLVIVGTVKQALQRAKTPKLHVKVFVWQALRDDYESLLRMCAKWVTVVDEPIQESTALDAFSKHGGL